MTILPAILPAILPLGAAAALAVIAAPGPIDARSSDEVAALRALGPAGLDTALERYDRAAPDQRDALAAEVDAVAGQRYATVSRLYWFTDLDRAEAEAHRLHRPILALRLLGDLRDDLSCANSRLFRATLYADADVSAFLRAHFVLYWSSARAVPTVTIDYGDGRKLVRTTTGNSAHYVLDDAGHVLDVLPGLYAPAVFRRELTASLALADRVRGMTDGDRVHATVDYHRAALADAERAEHSAPGLQLRFALQQRAGRGGGGHGADLAAAQAATMTKAIVEVPDLQQIGALRPGDLPGYTGLWTAVGQGFWGNGGPVLDAASRALITRLHNAVPAALRATPAEIDQMIARLEQDILADTAINQFALRSEIHRRIAATGETRFAPLDAWIYDDVFATPRSDAWMGLLPRTDFTGLPGDGVVLPR